MTYQEKINQFQDFIKLQFTDPDSGVFYEKSSIQMLDNVMDTISQNPNAVNILQNKEVMVNVGKLIGREDFLKPDGEFNPMVIFNFSKDEFGFDLLGKIPSFIKIPFLASIGLK